MPDRFSLKFVDVMIGVVLGLGFQWWPELKSTWQYIAFVFVYLNLIDYWIDYSPTLRKYPMKNQFDVILHTGIIFAMFFQVYTTHQSLQIFLLSYVYYRLIDIIWIWRMKRRYKSTEKELRFLNAWNISDVIEAIIALILMIIAFSFQISPLLLLIIFILFRIGSRIYASFRYNHLYFLYAKL